MSFAAEAFWKHLHAEKGEEVESEPPWEICERMCHERIDWIVQESGASGPPLLFFTGSKNFRNYVAVTYPYKAERNVKPFHYKNVRAYLKSAYSWKEYDGLEADDLIGIYMTQSPGTYICCTRDKDLRAIPGWHYGWEVGKQPAFGPELVDEIGRLELSSNRKKVIGTGAKFFHYQMLLGDSTDTIEGLPGYGVVKAFNTINSTSTLTEMEEAVAGAYKASYGLNWLDRMRETGRLLQMTRDVDGSWVKLYSPSFLDRNTWIDIETGEYDER